MNTIRLALLLPAVLVGCGSTVSDGDALSEIEEQVAAQCAVAESGKVTTLTQEDFESHLVKRWFRCEGDVFFGADDVGGIEFLSDGTWAFFDLAADGSVAPRTGFDEEGSWTILDMAEMNGPGSFQVNVEKAGGGTEFLFVRFAATPDRARIEATAGSSEFVAIDAQ